MSSVREWYAEKAVSWILEYLSTYYLLKVEECLKCEDRGAESFLSQGMQKRTTTTTNANS